MSGLVERQRWLVERQTWLAGLVERVGGASEMAGEEDESVGEPGTDAQPTRHRDEHEKASQLGFISRSQPEASTTRPPTTHKGTVQDLYSPYLISL